MGIPTKVSIPDDSAPSDVSFIQAKILWEEEVRSYDIPIGKSLSVVSLSSLCEELTGSQSFYFEDGATNVVI